jgi:hypothetical protein
MSNILLKRLKYRFNHNDKNKVTELDLGPIPHKTTIEIKMLF